jgi:type IV pilus assembly protein PilB
MTLTPNLPVNPEKKASEGRLRSGDEAFNSSILQSQGTAPAAKGRPFMASFLEHLVKNQVMSEDIALQVAQRRQEAGKDKRRLVELLAEEFGLSRELLYREVAKFYSFRIIELSDRSARRLPPAQVNKLLSGLAEPSYELAVKFKVLPYEIADQQPDKLLVVTPNPSDREAYDVARLFPYKKFEICYMTEADWAELWRQVNLEKQMTVTGAGGALDPVYEEDDAQLDSTLEREINRSQLVSMVDNVLTDAVRVGASDVHIVPRGARKTDLMFRIDGRLKLWYTVEDARAEAVVAVVKGRGLNLDRFERMAAQDGSAQKPIDSETIRFRISVIPIISRELNGKFESVVIRILRDADASASLEKIGFDAYSQLMFREAIRKPQGMVILTGPTGSGKSTTLVAALRSVMTAALNTITVEDPVEYLLDGARQVKLSHKLDFEGAMRAILRHDPDIVMVGEMRDRITADIAVKLANTGHLTFSTLHTNDAPSAVSRLFKMGVEPFLIAQALNIVVAQRLVRKLCDRCKSPGPSTAKEVLERAGFTPEEAHSVQLYRPVGCINCVEGFKGRTAIHETFYVNAEIRSLIMESGDRIDIDALRAAATRHGMSPLRRAGIELVKSGCTTLEEIISTTNHEE